jgi:hypothetical protein
VGAGAGDRSRDFNSGGNRGGFDGVDRGAQTRDFSQRGNQSLNSGGFNRANAGAGAAARPSGGMSGGARAGGRGGRR